ncbi:hypothetical protein Q648_01308 [Bartonella quintana JK 12]|uniref:Uncharacterized protein n=2 Tax=Bartonella quintana TaxID=803 RepID=W3TX51_BARQI|nr:hypothetical protein Q651_00960 [Bartonella quintana BQ2-D70]ETS13034.1 hypothetical protein Q650_01325 [Bartonella quintana JK 73rel]ETS15108.1 hypothetical protein Q649_01327 [Bartonella quintana JK 73]ETS16578.1 hypothetical protein Q648_01308 [Bartonella quintana JK 12]ETS17369.1 hypothetical protein Q647_01322 [Bartonella quintana JK 7]KEC57612.1 hypothetical protein O93_01272 [Bartonella quintana JK 19]KEC61000.1 hypothetical protein O91_00930 [Bartonella quintana JK 31]KEC61310.1 h
MGGLYVITSMVDVFSYLIRSSLTVVTIVPHLLTIFFS